MASSSNNQTWNWKAKDRNNCGLLYEAGNWGDFLKTLWLSVVLRWKSVEAPEMPTNYFDPFAGAVHYPLGKKTKFRYLQAGLSDLDYLKTPFIDNDLWPSSASAAKLLTKGNIEVFDQNQERRESWSTEARVSLLTGESGWKLLADRQPAPNALWLVDPYDVLAEWRNVLSMLVAKAESTTILLYIYNRSAKSRELFADYRNFRNALDDLRGDIPKRLGRVAADGFLPHAHHEMLLLPCRRDAENVRFPALSEELSKATVSLNVALERSAIFDL